MLELWIEDTERLVSALPQDAPIASRANYLLGKLANGCMEVNANVFSEPSFTLPIGTLLMVTRKDHLAEGNSELSPHARRLSEIAFIAHGTDVPSLIALPKHDSGAPFGNGHILLHEVEHFTEPEDSIPRVSKDAGMKERRAYKTNRQIMESLDGSDFSRYIDGWPVTFTAIQVDNHVTADIRFHDVCCPEPPLETFAHEFWLEGAQSQQVLQSIGRVTVLEQVASELPEALINQLVGGLYLPE